MTVAAFIPVKGHSERVPHKNTRMLGGRPLYTHIVKAAVTSGAFDRVYVDTDDIDIAAGAKGLGARLLDRAPGLAEDWANGNDLLVNHAERVPDVDLYCQLFATAPLLKAETIADAIRHLVGHHHHDSLFTATRENGWYWFQNQPVNFRPGILPRSQDAPQVIKETTGLYAIRRDSVMRYRCRIGATPYAYLVDPDEAVDLDTERDFLDAERILNTRSH